jgi:hypothetical protein
LADRQDACRETGRMMVTGAIVYDWLYPLLTKEDKQAFVAELVRLAKTQECGYPPTRQGSITGHSSEAMIMRDMISAGIAIYDEFPEMYRLAAGRFFREHLPARNWLYNGHAYHQGDFPGPGRTGVLVTDLTPGVWRARRASESNSHEIRVSQELGAAWFEASPGTWHLEASETAGHWAVNPLGRRNEIVPGGLLAALPIDRCLCIEIPIPGLAVPGGERQNGSLRRQEQRQRGEKTSSVDHDLELAVEGCLVKHDVPVFPADGEVVDKGQSQRVLALRKFEVQVVRSPSAGG